jgi:hypothetical protein
MNNTVTEFQVVETFDVLQNKIWKVELQYRQVIRTDHGGTVYAGNWETVPRVRLNCPEMK